MVYDHHGTAYGFSGDYNEYFGPNTDLDAMGYLTMANELIHQNSENNVSIAEDVSGYPTLCQRIEEGGVGFDYRLAMAVPTMWISILKEIPDE